MQQYSHQQGGQSEGSHNLANSARRVAAKSSAKWQRKAENGRVRTATESEDGIQTAAAAAGEQQLLQDGQQQQPWAQVCEKDAAAATTAGTGAGTHAGDTAVGNGTTTERAAGN